MFPLVSAEIPDFDLLRALNQGLIPSHYLASAEEARRSLKAYVHDYLWEEVQAEARLRNLTAFSRFFDALAFSDGMMVNYSAVGRDCGVDTKTVQEYYRIMTETFWGRFVEPFHRRRSRKDILETPKFYLFDCGVSSLLAGRTVTEPRGEAFGRAFEQFVFHELSAYSSYSGKDFAIRYWRTKTGLEVDFVLGDGEVAVEVKGGGSVGPKDLHGLKSFVEEFRPKAAFLVCQEARERVDGGLRVVPWRLFLERLWAGEII